MTEEYSTKEVTTHNEEATARKKSDKEDREKLMGKLCMSIDPLDTSNHPESIVNIVSRIIGPAKVNVDNAVTIGERQMPGFEEGWPGSSHEPLHHEVVTMAISKKHGKVCSTHSCDLKLIFSLVLGLSHARELSLKGSGEMRLTKRKSVLKQSFQVEVSDRLCQIPEVLILDGCAILWVIV